MMNEVTYKQDGDYLYPNLILPQEETLPIGKYGRMRKQYLKEYRKAAYNRMLLSGKLEAHLVEVDQNANNRMEILVSEMMKAENVTEEMKTTSQMKWLGMVNNIRHRAEEIILKEIIYS
ncbi:MAG: TnpV protein [Peptococcaceae bacterium]|nr:TnpV protein [Peptococcaceae bacterium]MBQ2035620.1 TnpV protein [Peptococcaceae bacterium]